MKRYLMLSFDVEEFDMPLEYQQVISEEEQMQVGKMGLDAIQPWLTNSNLETTLFTTANFASHFPKEIKSASQSNEIASHTHYHSHFIPEHLASSKQALEQIIEKPVTGLRMPRMREVSIEAVKQAGYRYDSSINPTWLPGRYNNWHLPRTYYDQQGLLRIPASVAPITRIPLFWLSFKNIPYSVFKWLALQTLKKDQYLCLYFHPWEFINLDAYQIPSYTKHIQGQALIDKLEKLIKDLSKEGEFIGMQNFVNYRGI